MPAKNLQLEAVQHKLDALQQTVTLMIENKAAREVENRLRDEKREQLAVSSGKELTGRPMQAQTG